MLPACSILSRQDDAVVADDADLATLVDVPQLLALAQNILVRTI